MRARDGVESALRVWNGMQLEILDFVFEVGQCGRDYWLAGWLADLDGGEKFYRKHSSLMGLAAGKN